MTEAELIYQFFVYYTNPWFLWNCGITFFLKLLDGRGNKYPQRTFQVNQKSKEETRCKQKTFG